MTMKEYVVNEVAKIKSSLPSWVQEQAPGKDIVLHKHEFEHNKIVSGPMYIGDFSCPGWHFRQVAKAIAKELGFRFEAI